MNKRDIFIVLILCLISVMLVWPTIHNNINDPNRIVYFSADEGGQMDIAWFYYSGEKQKSFQWDFDYGLEMFYLAKCARLMLSQFIVFTPGLFVLILRWINLIAWLIALFALWVFLKRHFREDEWGRLLIVALLASRPAFAYFSASLKPEPLTLLLLIIGLDYALRIIEAKDGKWDVIISIACAAAAFLIKYAGLFLIPVIVASIYNGKRYQKLNDGTKNAVFRKYGWLSPLFIGIPIIIVPAATLFFYVRKSTGATFFSELGFFESMKQNILILYIVLIGLFFVLLSLLLLLINRRKNLFRNKIINGINEINYYALGVFGVFICFVLILGFAWVLKPQQFINTCAELGSFASGQTSAAIINAKAMMVLFFSSLSTNIKSFDVIIMLLFGLYVSIEIIKHNLNKKNDRLRYYKRVTLATFLILPFAGMLSTLRMAQHHMLPFFAVASILGIEGCRMLIKIFDGRKLLKISLTVLIGSLYISDIAANAGEMIRARIAQFRQKEDVSYDIESWWLKNIPAGAKIVAEHYNRVYIPSGYENIRVLSWGEGTSEEKTQELRSLINDYQPEFVYYNRNNAAGRDYIPPLNEIIKGRKVKLIKYFRNQAGHYQSKPGANFVIYKLED